MSRRFTPRSDESDDDRSEDGTDPRAFHDRRGRHKFGTAGGRVPGRKALQLCRQVHTTLSALLAGSGDDVLRETTVTAVEPAPNAGRLLVVLATPADPAAAADAIHRAAGWVRSELAAGVHRRAVPELTFRVGPAGPPA